MYSLGHGGPRGPFVFSQPNPPLVIEALCRLIPSEVIKSVLEKTGRGSKRIRRLPAEAVVWLVIGIGLWADRDMASIWRQIVGTLRSLLLVLSLEKPPAKSALCIARKRLGPQPIRQLFIQTRRPLADTRVPGAFYRGMRVMVIDGVTLKVPDTPGNAKAFGRAHTTRSEEAVDGAYPQIRSVLLMEAGTHLVQEAWMRPGSAAEYPLAEGLLPYVPAGALVLWDRGFYGYRSLAAAKRSGVEVVGRVAAHVVFKRLKTLSDGSFLADIFPSREDRRCGTNGMTVRVIEYTIDDPPRSGHGEHHRLVTTLLNAEDHPATELVVLYHERWEIEIAIDELKTHQLDRLVELRSRTPCGVVQEFYGFLLAYNAIRVLMHEAAVCVQIDPRRLSFIHAVRVIREAIPLMRAAPTHQLPILYRAMVLHIAASPLPQRDNRSHPRVVKIKMSRYAKKRTQHCRPLQPQKPFRDSVVILK